MRFLADENFSRPLIESLRKGVHDVVWARTDYPGPKDSALIDPAEADGRIILTLDRDLLHLALQRPVALKRGGIILFRTRPATTSNLTLLLDAVLRSSAEWIGHASTVSPLGIETIPTGRPPQV
jgi:predicted nuclease of predicted toxin-antitoxin system